MYANGVFCSRSDNPKPSASRLLPEPFSVETIRTVRIFLLRLENYGSSGEGEKQCAHHRIFTFLSRVIHRA